MRDYSEAQAISQYGEENFPPASRWTGWITFAGMILAMLGALHILEGIIGLRNDDYFAVRETGLLVDASYTTWGWFQIIAGAVVLAAGLGVFTGQLWARAVGVVVALVSAVISLGFFAAYPPFAMLMIALNLVIIFALTVHGGELKPPPLTR